LNTSLRLAVHAYRILFEISEEIPLVLAGILWWTKPKMKEHSSLLGRALNRWGEGLQAYDGSLFLYFQGKAEEGLSLTMKAMSPSETS
jgi:hypothetical protein